MSNNKYNFLSSIYEHLGALGDGTFGVVTKARDKRVKDRVVALKRFKVKPREWMQGINFTALREIRILRDVNHPNVIKLYDVHVQENTIVMALELCATDLMTIINDGTVKISTAHIKAFMKMTLEGLGHLHKQFIIHRDLKPNNLLLTDQGILKLADFGFARSFGSPGRALTLRVATIEYRCPELLLCMKQYGSAIDMWSVGCIFAELMLRRIYLAGPINNRSELNQLDAIYKYRGVPTLKDWPGIIDLGDMQSLVTENQGRFFRKDFTTLPGVYGASEDAVDLLDKFLDFDPNKRITCEEALQHHYFTTAQPRPSKPSDLPIPVPFELREGGAISNRNNNMNNNNNNNNNQQQQQQMMMMDDSGSNNDKNDGVSRSLGF